MKHIILILLVFYSFGCKKQKVDNKYCIAKCIESYTSEYLNSTYSTQDKFVEQFIKLCNIKAEISSCYYSSRFGPIFSSNYTKGK